MKFRITMKDPDGPCFGFIEAAREAVELTSGLSDAEKLELVEQRQGEFEEMARKWLKYSELVTIEFDTDQHTATVIEVGK